MFHCDFERLQAWKFVYLPTIDSTQSYARQLLSNIEPTGPIVVYTDHQTAGMGQFGRKWHSKPQKGLTCSLIVPFPERSASISPFIWNMYIANVVAQTLNSLFDIRVGLKWPNDIMYSDRKLGGILINNVFKGEQIAHSIAGIGLNLKAHNYSGTNNPSISIAEIKETEITSRILLYCLAELLEVGDLANQLPLNAQMILNLYNQQLYNKGNLISCVNAEGERLEGVIKAVNADGQLVLGIGNTELRIHHGHYDIIY